MSKKVNVFVLGLGVMAFGASITLGTAPSHAALATGLDTLVAKELNISTVSVASNIQLAAKPPKKPKPKPKPKGPEYLPHCTSTDGSNCASGSCNKTSRSDGTSCQCWEGNDGNGGGCTPIKACSTGGSTSPTSSAISVGGVANSLLSIEADALAGNDTAVENTNNEGDTCDDGGEEASSASTVSTQ